MHSLALKQQYGVVLAVRVLRGVTHELEQSEGLEAAYAMVRSDHAVLAEFEARSERGQSLVLRLAAELSSLGEPELADLVS